MRVKPITRRLRVLRAERDWNQHIAAKRARIGMNRYVRIELGQTDPTPSELATLAKVFGVSELLPAPTEELAVTR